MKTMSPLFRHCLHVLLGVLGLGVCFAAQAERRALVLGNSNYLEDGRVNPKWSLPKSRADAQSMAQVLSNLGYRLHAGKAIVDTPNRSLSDTVDAFIKSVNKGDEVVFYYSGHGISTDGGGNFLVPTDAPVLDLDAPDSSLIKNFQSVDLLLKDLQNRAPSLVVAILDACRSYPTRQTNQKNHGQLLANPPQPKDALKGQLVMYATAHGRAAFDGLSPTDPDPHSVFTRVLLEEIKKPVPEIDTMVARVRQRVAALTEQQPRGMQIPETRSLLVQPFSFVPMPEQAAVPNATKDAEIARLREQLAQVQKTNPRPEPAQTPKEQDGFIVLPGGVARDKATGLEWMRCSLGQTWDGNTCTGEAKRYRWQEALDAAKQLNAQGGFAGKSDWRVPKIRELHGLIYCSKGISEDTTDLQDGGPKVKHGCLGEGYARPTIKQAVFPNTPADWAWSSSPYANYGDFAWVVYFNFGSDYYDFKYDAYRVRLVRSGQ